MGLPVEIFLTSPPDSSTCAICHDVLEDAASMKECGHTFCDGCAKDCLRADYNTCPNCRVQVTGTIPNFYARESIGSMQVKCMNGHGVGDDQASTRRRGNDGEAVPPENCTWTGRCEDAMTHQNVCCFKVITCDWEGCGHQCMRKYMNDHLTGNGSLRHMNLMKQSLTASFHSEIERVKRSITASYEYKIAEMRKQIEEMKEHYDKEIKEIHLNALTEGSRVTIRLPSHSNDWKAEVLKCGSGTKEGQFLIHYQGQKKAVPGIWVNRTDITGFLAS